jgi:hypothetical protein
MAQIKILLKIFLPFLLLAVTIGCGGDVSGDGSGISSVVVHEENNDSESSSVQWTVHRLSEHYTGDTQETGSLTGVAPAQSAGNDSVTFDDESIVSGIEDTYPYEGSPVLSLETSDGLRIELATQGGAVTSVESSSGQLTDQSRIYASGFIVHDLIRDSDFLNLGGYVQREGDSLVYNAEDIGLGLSMKAVFSELDSHIDVDIDLRDLTSTDRALTLYFALPIDMTGWMWGEDMRISRPITGTRELRNTVDVDYGAHDKMSRYPIAAISGIDGLAIGYPLDNPAVIRLVANPETNQLYIAYDVALSPLMKTPGRTKLKAVIYRFDPEWGFRSAMKKYYEIYPQYFEKRVTNEGIWVPFSALDEIPDLQDFGVAYHETFDTDYRFNDVNNIYSFRFINAPWTSRIPMPESLPNNNYDQIMEYVQMKTDQGDSIAETIMNSGSFDAYGKFISEPHVGFSWCSYCALFTVSPDPDISEPGFTSNRATILWNNDRKSKYDDTSMGVLDGEYIDYLGKDGIDYRGSHIGASDLPLTYNKDILKPAVPLPFANYEFSKWVSEDVHKMNKLMMGNGALKKFPFFAGIFDVMGLEVNWIKDGEFIEPWSVRIKFWRTMSYKKPVNILTNSDFSIFTRESLESYFKVALFYGMYPSIHSFDSLGYWDNAVYYERDRPLFKKYITLIQKLGTLGWEPVTYITSSETYVYVERFGLGESLYVTTRNEGDQSTPYELILDSAELEIPGGISLGFEDCITGEIKEARVSGSDLIITDTLAPGDVRMLSPIFGGNSGCSK